MKRRALLLLPVAALATFEALPTAAGDTQTTQLAFAPTPVERFRFHAGAPLLAPAGAGGDGSVCVGTADGYVHLLASDGSFRWSHSVHGAVTRRPVLVGRLWLVATSAERIYALTVDGTLYWVFRPPSPPASELAADALGTTYFVGVDHFLYGVSAHGGVSLRAPFGEPKAGPSAGSDGTVWAENQAGNVVNLRGQEVRRIATGSASEFDFGSAEALRDPEGHEWRVRVDGVVEFRRELRSSPNTLTLTSAPLLSPTWSASGHYALISARDGLVVALEATRDGQSH